MHSKGRNWSTFFLFLLGLGSETKTYFYGCVAFSELVVFAIAPLILMRNFRRIKYEGFATPVYMIIGLMCSLFFSSWINDTPLPFIIKSFAVMYGVLSYYIVFTQLLKTNPKGLGWFFVGAAFSTIITIFAFNPQAIVTETGSGFIGKANKDDIIGGPLFWIQRTKAFGQLPIMGWYLQTPILYSLLIPLVFTGFTMLTTISGRSAALSILLAGAFIIIGKKRRSSMRLIGKHFLSFVIIGIVVVFAYKAIYKYAALNGWMGNDALTKYENQTKRGGGIIDLLVSGRKEFFIALQAVKDRPILGFGARAEDTNGYALRFLKKYGDSSEIAIYSYSNEMAMRYGYRMEIPTHSHIMGAWVHYGLFGLIFYCWLLYVIYRHIKLCMHVVPHWFGYFALTIGSYLWHIFFSPPGNRAMLGLFIATLFVAKAFGDGRIILPYELELEAKKYD